MSELRVFSDYSIQFQLFQISIIILRQVIPSASLLQQPKIQAVSLPLPLPLYYATLYGLGNYVACICSDGIDTCFQHISFPECRAYQWDLLSLFGTSAQSPVSFLLHILEPPKLNITVLYDFAMVTFTFWTNGPKKSLKENRIFNLFCKR